MVQLVAWQLIGYREVELLSSENGGNRLKTLGDFPEAVERPPSRFACVFDGGPVVINPA